MRIHAVLLLAVLAMPARVHAQQDDNGSPVSDASENALFSVPTIACDSPDFDGSSELELTRFKKQAIQSLAIASGRLQDPDSNGLSSTYAEFSIGSGIPLGSFENVLGVKPRVRIDWIEAESAIDIPEELYVFEVQFFHRRRINDQLSAIAIISPSVRSDLTNDDDAFRVFALGLLNWEAFPKRLTISAGAVYLGRADLPVLPALGLQWTPTSRNKLDLRFPNSRWSYRLAKNGGESELWSYLSAGLGGNTWAVTRRSGSTDLLSLRDFRFGAGMEKLRDGGGFWFVETGAALGRRLEYEQDLSELDLNTAFFLSGGWSY